MCFHTYVRSFVFFCFCCKTTFFRRSALGAQRTDTDNYISSAGSVLQPAGHNATRRTLFLIVCCSYRTLPSVIEDRAGTCRLLFACAIRAIGRQPTLLCCCCAFCFAADIDSGSSSEAAESLPQAAERATVRAHLCLLYTSPSPRDRG